MTHCTDSVKRSHIEVSSKAPCPHCGKPDWCYVLGDGNMSGCKRGAEPGSGWYRTGKTDRDGTTLYATIASKEAFLKQRKGNKGDKGSPIAQYRHDYKLITLGEKGDFLTHLGKAKFSPESLTVFRKEYTSASKDIYQGYKLNPFQKYEWKVPNEPKERLMPYGIEKAGEYLIWQSLSTEEFIKVADKIPPVFFVEGERKADLINQRDGVAISGYGGSGKWKKAYSDFFLDLYRWHNGKERENWQQIVPEVILCPDRDKQGLKYSSEILKDLVGSGYPRNRIKWFFPYGNGNWNNVPDNGGMDIADMFNDNSNLSVEDILKQLKTTEECPWLELYLPELFEGKDSNSLPLTEEDIRKALTLRQGKSKVKSTQDWLVEDLLPNNKSVLLTGEPGCGKSFAMIDLCAAVVSGKEWMGKQVQKGNALILNNDQTEQELINYMSIRAGDSDELLDGLQYMDGWTASDTDLKSLQAWVAEQKAKEMPFLVVMDSLRQCICNPLELDENRNETGKKVDEVAKIVTRAGGCFIVIHHENKSGGNGVAKAAGHTSIVGNLGTHWRITKSPEGNVLSMPKVRGYKPVETIYLPDFETGMCQQVEKKEKNSPTPTSTSEARVNHEVEGRKTTKQDILYYLAVGDYENGYGASVEEIVTGTRRGQKAVEKALGELRDAGDIKSVTDPLNPRRKLHRLSDQW